MTGDPKIRTATVTESHARDVIQTVTGRVPGTVTIESRPSMIYGSIFREHSADGLHRYVFEGDGNTARARWHEALHEVCGQEACLKRIDPRTPVTGDANDSTVPLRRFCPQHGFKGRTVHFARP